MRGIRHLGAVGEREDMEGMAYLWLMGMEEGMVMALERRTEGRTPLHAPLGVNICGV